MTAIAIRIPRSRHRRVTAGGGRLLLFVLTTIALVFVGGAAWAYWTVAVVGGSLGSAAATSVNAGATPTAGVSGSSVTVSWAASTLATGQAVTGYEIKRYNASTLAVQTTLSACNGVVTSTSCVEASVPDGTWRYTVTPLYSTNWRGAESAMSTAVTVDTVAPSNAISLNTVTGNALLTGTTVYYRGVALGSFTLTNAVTDSSTGPASSQTNTLGGTSTGWTHTPSTVSTPAGGPYVSNTFSWTAGTTTSPTEAVIGRDVAGNTATTNLTFVNDSAGPTGGTISYLNGAQPGKSVTVTFSAGTDAGAGIASRQLQRAEAAVTSGGVCGTSYSSFADVGPAQPTSPYVDTTVVNAYCYKYQYVVTDALGNQSITTSASVSMVDYRQAVIDTTGQLSRWRLDDASTAGAMDDKGPADNNGTYVNGPGAGVVGALPNDANTAVLFNGVNQYATMTRQIAGDFSVEVWLKSSQNFVGNLFGQPECSQWWQGAGLIDADLGGSGQDFGVSMCKGKIVAGVGTPEVSVVSTGTYNDNQWHHVVFTRTQSTGALALYVDGTLVGSATANTGLLNSQATMNIGRVAYGDNYFAGVLDEAAVYTSVLSAATVANHYQLGSSVVADVTGPTGGSVDATGLTGTGSRYSTTTLLNIAFTPGTDASGMLAAGRTLTIATATLSGGTCGTFGSYGLAVGGNDPTSPLGVYVGPNACYRFQYQVADARGNMTTYTSPDIKVDITAPAGGSVDATGLVGTGGRYSTSTNLSIAFSPGTDANAGLVAAGRTLTRATATLTNGTCGTYGGYALVTGGTDPTSPKADMVTAGACYRYQYTVSDNAGNSTTYTSGDIKVDTTAPSTPTLAISAATNAYWSGSGTTVYYNSGAATGSFTVTGTSTDAQSGIASWTYPAAGTNWTSTPGALGVNTYSWSGTPAAPGTLNVTSTSNAGTASANSPLIFTADNTAPTGATVSYLNGVYWGTSVSVTLGTPTDAGSGIASRVLQRATATQTANSCGTFGGFTNLATNPTSPYSDSTVTTGTCYMYRYVVTDNVGNQQIATSANVARAPGAIWTLNEGSGTTSADATGNGSTLVLASGASWTTGRNGTAAMNLTGTATSFGYAQCNGASCANRVVETSESHTAAVWVKLNDLTGNQTFAAVDGTNISPFYLQLTGGQFAFAQRTSDSTAATLVQVTGLSPAVGTWYHVAGVYDKAAGTIALYVNGTLQGSATAGTSWTAFGTAKIGQAKWNGAAVDFVKGAIDDARFYGRALSAAEITALASAPATWTFNEGTGTTAADSSGYFNTATLQAGAGWTTGRVGPSALNLTGGSTSWASAGRVIDTTESFSVAGWVKLNSTAGYQTLVAFDGTQSSAFNLQTNGAGAFRFFQTAADTAAPSNASSTGGAPVTGTWYHLTGVYNKTAGTIQLYINGVAQPSATAVTSWSATGSTTIGRAKWAGANTDYLNGAIDDVRLYQRVLTPAEIAALAAM